VSLDRRDLLIGAAAVAASSAAAAADKTARYGLIGRIRSLPGRRAELRQILASGTGQMPGCLAYIVADDAADAESLWVTEVWESKDAHAASLKLPQVRDAISKGRPLIVSFDSIAETHSASGHGLAHP
jgi:quinol monooxygenase YgiN